MYELVDDYVERRSALRPEHLALARAAQQRGELLLAGALADPYDRALLVFAGEHKDAAEAFARADPYVINGLVTAWTVRQWNEVLEP
ncbi:MAG: YciI-like protein [Ilumatobacteraceae bacterium]